MVYRNVIVCHMVPGSEDKVGPVFAHYDEITRPQDLGVIGRILLSYEDLYIHVIERKEDPEVSGQRRGLPAFQKIAEEIAPYVTPYPRYWENPSHSVAKEFYRYDPDDRTDKLTELPTDSEMTVIVQRIEPGVEPEIERIFKESDSGSLPSEMGVEGRWLYSIDDVFLHVLEQDAAVAQATRGNHTGVPAFAKVMQELAPLIQPYVADPSRGPLAAAASAAGQVAQPAAPQAAEAPRGPQARVARPFYRWRAED